MIPADHIAFDGDTAWWVTPSLAVRSLYPVETLRELDRPCRLCWGSRKAYPEHLRGGMVALDTVPGYDPRVKCDCIDGRHTFDIEVEWCNPDLIGAWESKTYRVSIVPGTVLPIVEQDADADVGCSEDPHVCVFYGRSGGEPTEDWTFYDGDCTEQEVALPLAAKPGMWAVQLRVAP